MASILVTGANGFVGASVCAEALRRNISVTGAIRNASLMMDSQPCVSIGALDAKTDWHPALRGVESVIHLAARVHVMHDTSADPLAAFREVNVAGTENLARQAAAAGVKRLVFASSIKVNGEETVEGRKFTESDVPSPQDHYAVSKLEAELALHRVAAETGLEVVIIRLPLVYGPGVKGNFIQMIKAVASGIPLPLAAVRNARSLVYLGNLVDALILCATHPVAAGSTYLISDGEDVSTPQLLQRLAVALGCPARLWPCPPALLKLIGKWTGKSAQLERLLGSLQVDSGKIRRELDWSPPYTLQQGLQATAEWYKATGLSAKQVL